MISLGNPSFLFRNFFSVWGINDESFTSSMAFPYPPRHSVVPPSDVNVGEHKPHEK